MNIAVPRWPLNLYPLAHEIKREYGRLCSDACHHARSGIASPERQVQPTQRQPKHLIHREEDTHEGYDLPQPRAETSKEPAESFVSVYAHNCSPERCVDALIALRSEPCPQQVQGIRSRRGCCAGCRARDEGLGRLWYATFAEGALEQLRRAAVGRELNGAVADIHQLGGHIALPQARKSLISEDVFDRGQSALVDRSAANVLMSQRVGERMCLQLETNLDDIEGGYDEAII